MTVRRPVAAGTFYPRDPETLAATVDGLLGAARPDPSLRGVVVPHAGYVYSGPVAAAAFRLVPRRARVALLGPSHFVPLDGLAVSSASAWATPLGEVPVDDELHSAALDAGARLDDRPHERDHAVEVALPFLQRACADGLTVLPVAVGRCPPDAVAGVAGALDALVVVSTDLSHYLDDTSARRVDRRTADAVVACDATAIRDDAACGAFALRGLVEHARRSRLAVEVLELRTSADSSRDRRRVVGYGAFALSRRRA